VPTLRFDSALAERIHRHAAESYPHECCGALLGRDAGSVREVVAVLPLPNRRQDAAHNRFVIYAEDVRQAERAAHERGLELVGWYHSHPDHPARPSEYDREHAWPWYSYVIVRSGAAESRELTSWRLAEDRHAFEPEEIEIAASISQQA
jgi:proteasome lid subunit RPN8/RPN11